MEIESLLEDFQERQAGRGMNDANMSEMEMPEEQNEDAGIVAGRGLGGHVNAVKGELFLACALGTWKAGRYGGFGHIWHIFAEK